MRGDVAWKIVDVLHKTDFAFCQIRAMRDIHIAVALGVGDKASYVDENHNDKILNAIKFARRHLEKVQKDLADLERLCVADLDEVP